MYAIILLNIFTVLQNSEIITVKYIFLMFSCRENYYNKY